jgi:hypothetical protein
MRTRYRKILVAAALTALALTAIFASAANAATPAPPYQDFAGCPSEAENQFVGDCVKYEFTGGHIGLGNREIPVSSPIVLRGGVEQQTSIFLNNGEGGIIPVQQTVPGGLIGLTGYQWLDEALGSSDLLKLHATVELAGEPKRVIKPPVTLPIKVHLENPFLGENCYVGSEAEPITLHLATTRQPSKLAPETERPQVLVSNNGLFADSAYSVPAANGCEFNFGPIHRSLDELVNSRYSLPAAAGVDTTELDFNLSITFPDVIYP